MGRRSDSGDLPAIRELLAGADDDTASLRRIEAIVGRVETRQVELVRAVTDLTQMVVEFRSSVRTVSNGRG